MSTYIDPAGKPLAHLDRLAAWQAGAKPAPVTLEWDLSNRCYLGCQSCHFSYTHTRGPWAATSGRLLPMAHDRAGDLAETTGVVRVLREAAAVGVKSIVWTGGGEPTTHPDWRSIVAYAAKLGLQQGMYTAGGLLTEDSAQDIAKHATWIVVSLDAADAETYAAEKRVISQRFHAACNGVRWMAQAGGTVGVSFLLHAVNWPHAQKMLDVSRSLGATYTTFRPTIETQPNAPAECSADRAWVSEALPLLVSLEREADVEVSPLRFKQYRDWNGHPYKTCHGIKLNATITPDLRMWVCPNRREFADSCIGDLKTESFAEVWARHPGQWTDFAQCRVMCRLHAVNETLGAVFSERKHEAFI